MNIKIKIESNLEYLLIESCYRHFRYKIFVNKKSLIIIKMKWIQGREIKLNKFTLSKSKDFNIRLIKLINDLFKG